MDIVKGKLSVIIPFCNEHPQAAFTIQNIFCELRDFCDFEIIAINNWCNEVATQGRAEDKGGEYLQSLATPQRPWLKVFNYDKKLSHWQAKNLGVQNSTGEFLWFCDAHCIVSRNALQRMLGYFTANHEALNGTLHLPLSYMLEKPGLELIYKLVTDMDKAVVHYSFTRYRQSNVVYQVPCMSTCGMMMTRELYDLLGGWPEELGIYGGGEHFINFTLAVLGKTINIWPDYPLFHYAAKRGYSWNYDDYHRNRCIATFMYGGFEMGRKYIMNIKGRPQVLERMYYDIATKKSIQEQEEALRKKEVIPISEWVNKNTQGGESDG